MPKKTQRPRPWLEQLEDRCVPAATTLGYHDIQTDAAGNIAPWFDPDPGTSYDHVLSTVWNFWRNVPTDRFGMPAYYSYRDLGSGDQLNSTSEGIGGDQFAMAIDSWVHYYQYTGDSAVLKNATDIADFYLANSLTPSDYVYGNLPYPANNTGTEDQLVYDGDLVAGPGVLQPDKAGSFGQALVSLYEVTGNTNYLSAAVNIANTLAATVNFNADQANSPWPFRVVAQTGDQPADVDSAYTTNYGPTLSLFQSLGRMGQGNTTAYNKAFTFVLGWMRQYPMTDNSWGPFFEDIRVYSDTQINADTWAYYLMQNPSWDANWQQDARGILDWVQSTDGFGDPTWDGVNWADYGVTPIDEQTAYPVPGQSHTALHASTELTYDALAGDTTNTDGAVRQLNWATYMVDTDGTNRYPNDGVWLTDGYGDYARYYLRAMAADPALAPADQNHLLGTSSFVQSIQYKPGSITYTTADAGAQDVLRINFVPDTVQAGGVALPRLNSVADLQTQDGYTFGAPGDAAGVLRIHHSQSGSVSVTGSATTSTLPAGFTDADVGAPRLAGSAKFDGTTWTVRGGGADMWGDVQQFNFAYQTVTGDQTIVAQVTGVQDTDPSAGAGVLFRDGTDTTAAYANVFVTPEQGVLFQWRPSAGAPTQGAQVTGITAPVWVELVGAGGTYSAYYSTDGVNWTQIGSSVSITFGNSSHLAGLAVTAHDNDALNTSTFTNLSITPTPPGGP